MNASTLSSLFQFWLDPLGLTLPRLALSLFLWVLFVITLLAILQGGLLIFRKIRRRSILKKLQPFLMNPENDQIPFPQPVFPGDRAILVDEILDIGHREKGIVSLRIKKELSRPFWIHYEFLQMTSFRPGARAAASRRLGDIGEPKALPFLNRACMDPFAKVRRAAARSLFAVDPKAFALLLPRFFSNTSTWQRGEVESLFLELGREATPSLQKVLDSSNEEVRERAVILLGKLGDSKALEMLMALTKTAGNTSLRRLAEENLKNT